ncbi:type II toxin-antitoxin system RelE family toxin [Desulfitibacter alkalitolerans]|uniref:type II toxin-antitoxin system RelE family toxin n=1 Tax=Desulfitibacter alkalitolerans TaxID=264641 RepID=UPI000486F4C1|nr:type II toxin-antitoxin system RelE/ParE family toxin [Desulfitibacter alkalitolerans]
MKIRYTRSAVKIINCLDKDMKIRIKSGIEGLTGNPPKGDIKKIQGTSPSLYRLRVGTFRIVYEYTSINGEVELIIKDIGSRGDIYK